MRMLLGISMLIAIVAAIDAARGAHWDQFALLCVLGALGFSFNGSTFLEQTDDPGIVNWVEQQAALTDDDPSRVVDRALAAYRAQMLSDTEDGRVGP